MQDSSLYSHIQPQFPEQEQLKCPRCDSPNTKFCYYNNYNLSQPRHFCKSCKRYWTKGGALRNIPVGGGSRKAAKRSSSSSASSAAKRPASAKDKKESENSNTSGEIAEALPQKGENFGGQFENLSFSSLLGSNGDQFVSLLDGLGPGGPGMEINEHFGDPGSGRNGNPDLEIGGGGGGGNEGEFLNLHGGGETSCWGGGGGASGGDWPDLAIYTPSSNFQ